MGSFQFGNVFSICCAFVLALCFWQRSEARSCFALQPPQIKKDFRFVDSFSLPELISDSDRLLPGWHTSFGPGFFGKDHQGYFFVQNTRVGVRSTLQNSSEYWLELNPHESPIAGVIYGMPLVFNGRAYETIGVFPDGRVQVMDQSFVSKVITRAQFKTGIEQSSLADLQVGEVVSIRDKMQLRPYRILELVGHLARVAPLKEGKTSEGPWEWRSQSVLLRQFHDF